MWDKRYTEQVKLLVGILPFLAKERRFALKGGTAINLFEQDLPRLSIDIDLTWLPVKGFTSDTRDISSALQAIGATLKSVPLRLQVQTSGTAASGVYRLLVGRDRARVQIETSPVMRGSVHPVRTMRVRPMVEQIFGFAEMQVLDFADLYAGKLCAALSRQHPRDFFDLQHILEGELFDDKLWRTFLVYLTCSQRPVADLLAPRFPNDFEQIFLAHFKGMTSTPVSVDALLAVRARLLESVSGFLDAPSRAFLESVEREVPDFDLIGLAHAKDLPGMRHKLQNLGLRTPQKRAADLARLLSLLA